MVHMVARHKHIHRATTRINEIEHDGAFEKGDALP